MADMNIYSKRLHSFRNKRRPSAASSSSSKPLASKWPHEHPSAKTLAAAGFFFNQTEGHPDNVTCYLCGKDLDGWEPDDDPSVEHLKHCPDCGWARIAVTQEVGARGEDPRGGGMTDARLQTFGAERGWWPHEGKQGWLPTSKRMAEAGWHYAPTKDSDDFAKCAYCDLSLDGWEPSDDPLEEHRRRSPECVFFTWTAPKQPAARKTSRASMQSVMANSDDEPVTKPAKKAARSKKSKKVELEPEVIFDDAPPRGRKRTSTVARQGPVIIYDGTISTESEVEPEPQQPAQKKRATRASLAAQQLSRDVKNADSDNESMASMASKVGGKAKAKPKKPAGRRASRTRGGSVARKTKTQPTVLSDDELDRALALGLERPLTDEEEGFKDFKEPFIRPPTKRLTRSRASLAVEERMRNAPPDTILNSTAKRGRSRTPGAAAADVERSPTKRFFRDSGQDFSVPVRVPKHLATEDEGFAGDTIKVASSAKELTDTEMEIEVKPIKKPTRKPAVRGRKKKGVAEPPAATTEDEPATAPKLKRSKATSKKAAAATRESNITVDSVQERIELQLHQEQEARPPRRRLVRGVKPARESIISISSTAEPEPEQAPSIMDVDDHNEASDEGSVIHHDVDAPRPTLAPSPPRHSPEVEMTEAEPAAPTPVPVSIPKPTKRATRSSVASTTADDTDVSYPPLPPPPPPPPQPTRKAAKNTDKKQQARTAKAKNDALKKGSESFFSSAQGEELMGRKGKRTTRSSIVPAETEDSSAWEGTVTGGVRLGGGSFGDVQMADATSSVVVVTDNEGEQDTTDMDAADHELESEEPTQETTSEEEHHAPVAATTTQTPARMPLSPVRRGMNMPVGVATPQAKATQPPARKAWAPIDLDAVFAQLNAGAESSSDEGAGMLSAQERDMTVAEWVKWNAAQAERRVKGEGERVVGMFEMWGRVAREALGALEVID